MTVGKDDIDLFTGPLVVTNLAGPWTLATRVRLKSADRVAQELAKQRVVDLMTSIPDQKPS